MFGHQPCLYPRHFSCMLCAIFISYSSEATCFCKSFLINLKHRMVIYYKQDPVCSFKLLKWCYTTFKTCVCMSVVSIVFVLDCVAGFENMYIWFCLKWLYLCNVWTDILKTLWNVFHQVDTSSCTLHQLQCCSMTDGWKCILYYLSVLIHNIIGIETQLCAVSFQPQLWLWFRPVFLVIGLHLSLLHVHMKYLT